MIRLTDIDKRYGTGTNGIAAVEGYRLKLPTVKFLASLAIVVQGKVR